MSQSPNFFPQNLLQPPVGVVYGQQRGLNIRFNCLTWNWSHNERKYRKYSKSAKLYEVFSESNRPSASLSNCLTFRSPLSLQSTTVKYSSDLMFLVEHQIEKIFKKNVFRTLFSNWEVPWNRLELPKGCTLMATLSLYLLCHFIRILNYQNRYLSLT